MILIDKNGFLSPKKKLKKTAKAIFRGPFPQHLHKKSEKSNEGILHKVQKTLFLGSFWPNFAQKFFFENRAPWALPFCTFVPKIRKN